MAFVLSAYFDSYNCNSKEIAKQALDIDFKQFYEKYKEINKAIDDYKSILELSDILLLNIDDETKTYTCKATFKINLKGDNNKKIYSNFINSLNGRDNNEYFFNETTFNNLENINKDSFKLKYNLYGNNRGNSIIEVYE